MSAGAPSEEKRVGEEPHAGSLPPEAEGPAWPKRIRLVPRDKEQGTAAHVTVDLAEDPKLQPRRWPGDATASACVACIGSPVTPVQTRDLRTAS